MNDCEVDHLIPQNTQHILAIDAKCYSYGASSMSICACFPNQGQNLKM